MGTPKVTYIFLFFLLFTISVFAQDKTFTNPLLPSGADPYSTYYNGYYYYTNTLQNRLVLWKTKNLAALDNAESITVWTPPEGTDYSKDIWAPEVHFINKKWYIYFAADDGHNKTHRMYVLENSSKDPFKGEWEFKGKIAAKTDKWAIDGNVFNHKGQLYMIWSGWEGDTNGQQDIFIAKMKNPLEIDGERAKISSPKYEWEKHGDLDDPDLPHVNVNEGPQFLAHKDRMFSRQAAAGPIITVLDFYHLMVVTIYWRLRLGKNRRNRFLLRLRKMEYMLLDIMHFLSLLMVNRIGFYIMPILNLGRVVVGFALQECKGCIGIPVECPIWDHRYPRM